MFDVKPYREFPQTSKFGCVRLDRTQNPMRKRSKWKHKITFKEMTKGGKNQIHYPRELLDAQIKFWSRSVIFLCRIVSKLRGFGN